MLQCLAQDGHHWCVLTERSCLCPDSVPVIVKGFAVIHRASANAESEQTLAQLELMNFQSLIFT